MAKSQKVVISVEDAALDDIQGVEKRLSAKGLKVDRVMPLSGMISGSVPSAKLSSLRSVKGVMSVEEELNIQLPPADSGVQ